MCVSWAERMKRLESRADGYVVLEATVSGKDEELETEEWSVEEGAGSPAPAVQRASPATPLT